MSFNRAEVSLSNLLNNFNVARTLTKGKTKMFPVVKANGYGLGAVEISKMLVKNGADCLCVAILEEGLELREAGITAPILVLGAVPYWDLEKAVKNNITLNLFKEEDAVEMNKIAQKVGIPLDVHIKVETGMNRLGFAPTEKNAEIIKRIYALPYLNPVGIFSHMAAADNNDDYTAKQVKTLTSFIELLKSKGITFPTVHLAASSGIELHPETYFNTVRPGIMLYGSAYSDYGKEHIKQVVTLRSAVTCLHTVDTGESVGYGCTYKATEPRLIATIPIGYADGYPRALSNRGYMLIHGKKAPITGRVCMDQTMVDVTDIENVAIGDEVIVYGTGPNGAVITIDEIADMTGTIPHEILTTIGRRIPRVHVE